MRGDLTTRLRPLAAALALTAVLGLGALTGWAWLRVPAGLALVLVAPGLLLVRLFFAKVPWWYAATLTPALSFLVAIGSLLLLELFGVAASPATVAWPAAAVTLVLAAATAIKSTPLSRPARPRRLTGPVVAAAAAVVLAGSAWTVAVASDRPAAATPVTQVGLVAVPGDPRAFTASVTNLSGAAEDYRMVVLNPGKPTLVERITLPDGDSWSAPVTATEAGTIYVTVYAGDESRAYEVKAAVL